MPTINDAFPSKHLKHEDLQGRRVNVVIETYQLEKIGDDKKYVLYFQGKEKGLVLNVTKARMLEMLTGSDDFDKWIGTRITLRPGITTFQGQAKKCIEIDSELPDQNSQQPPRRPVAPPPQQDLDDNEIPF